MAAPKVTDLLEKYKQLEERGQALRLQIAKDEARRENDQRQYDEIMGQLEAQFKTRDLTLIRQKIEQEKEDIQAELEAFEAALVKAETERAECQAALDAIESGSAATNTSRASS